jgi:hypothetical protein
MVRPVNKISDEYDPVPSTLVTARFEGISFVRAAVIVTGD